VRAASGQCLIVDAGTGLRALGQKLARETAGRPGNYHVLLSHVHWDHIQGLPFFEPAYIPGTHVHVYALLTAADELHEVISGITRHEFFPVPLEMVPAVFQFNEVEPRSPLQIDGFSVLPIALNHPFGSVGYRFDADATSWAYVADTAPFTEVLHKQHFLSGLEELTEGDKAALGVMRTDLIAALRGVDTVVYDTHYLPEEYARFPHYGHSTPEHAIEVCTAAQVRRLVLYHHAPAHDDEQMDTIAARYHERGAAAGIDVVTAWEGMVLDVGPGTTAPEGPPP
jgi:phosphoribosyl 1,2-cyclic phosphodiesterase